MVLGVVTTVFTEAMVLSPCQAERRSPVVIFFNRVFILQFSSFYDPLDLPVDLLFFQCRAGKENPLFFIKDFLELLGDPGFIIGVDGDCF